MTPSGDNTGAGAGAGHRPQYRRIAARREWLFSTGSLWLADDHVLQVVSFGLQERYQRVFLRDLKALLIAHSDTRSAIVAVSGIGAILFGMFAMFTLLADAHGVVMFFPWFVFFLSLALGALALWRGRTCKVYAVTGLQTVYWRALADRRRAGQLIERLRPLIEGAQAGMAPSAPVSPAPLPPPAPPQTQPAPGDAPPPSA